MSTTNEESGRDPYIGGRVDEVTKRKAEIRARQKGMNMTEYLTSLIQDDLEGVDYFDAMEFD